jgi:hypothetical protein
MFLAVAEKLEALSYERLNTTESFCSGPRSARLGTIFAINLDLRDAVVFQRLCSPVS